MCVVTKYRTYTNEELMSLLASIAGRSPLIDEIALRLDEALDEISSLDASLIDECNRPSADIECDVCGATVKPKPSTAEKLQHKLKEVVE